jgi:hypothetical protein
MPSKNVKNVIFIENSNQVSYFQDYFNKKDFNSNYRIIAIGPSAQSALIKINIPFIKSDQYFKNDDHIQVLKKADQIINSFRDEFSLKDFLNVEHAYETDFFTLLRYYYLNYCLSILTIIHNATSDIQPEKIICPPSQNISNIRDNSLSRTSLIGNLGKLYSEFHDFEVVLKTKDSRENKVSSPERYSKTSFLIHRLFFSIQLVYYKFFSKRKNIIMSFHSAYNIPSVIDNIANRMHSLFIVGGSNLTGFKLLLSVIRGKRGNFFKFPPPSSKNELDKFFADYNNSVDKIINKINSNPKLCTIYDVCLNKLIIDHMQNGLKNKLKDTFFGSIAFNKILNIKKPSLLISNQAAGYHYALGEQCRNNNINAMLISHGTHVPHDNIWAKKEWDHHARFMIKTYYPLVSVQTPWTEKFLLDHSQSKNIKTGPLLFSKPLSAEKRKSMKKKLFPNKCDKKIILHAASPFGWYVMHPYVNLTHDEYITHINHLIKSIEKMDGVFLAIRIRLKSFRGMSLDDIKSLLIKSDCYQIYTEGSFEEYLLGSDLLVSFSSTTIEEALQVKIPVLQYDPFNRYCHIPSTALNEISKPQPSPIYYISSYKDLLPGLNWIKSSHLCRDNSDISLDYSLHILDCSEDWINQIVDNKLLGDI